MGIVLLRTYYCFYRCHYCRYFDDFEGVLDHSIQVHANEEIKVRRQYLCDQTGDIKYQVLNCGLIPNTPILSNVSIDNNNWTVTVNVDESSKKRVRHNEQ